MKNTWNYYVWVFFLQVLRNHELVGQIRLDELEARRDGTSQEEGQPASDIGAITDCGKVSSGTQTENLADVKTDDKHLQIKEARQSPNPAGLKDLDEEDQQQAGTEKTTEVAAEEDLADQAEKKDGQLQENQSQLKRRSLDGNNVRNFSLKEKIVKLSEGSPDKRPALPLNGRMFNDSDAKIEEHILRCVLQLEKDGSPVKMRRRSEMDPPIKSEMKMEAALAHSHLREYLLFNNWPNNLKNQDGAKVASTKTNPAKPTSVRVPSHFSLQRHSLPHGGRSGQCKLGTRGVSFTASNDQQMESPGRGEKVENSCGENEGLTEEERRVGCCEEEDQGVDEVTHRSKKPRLGDGAAERAENPRHPEGMFHGEGSCQAIGLKYSEVPSSCKGV